MNYSDTVFDKCLRTVIRNDREQVIFIIRFTVCFMSSVLQKNEHVRDHVRPKDRSGEQYQFIIRTHFNGVRPNTSVCRLISFSVENSLSWELVFHFYLLTLISLVG